MLNDIVAVMSGLSLGSLLGVFAKSLLDKQQLKFSKVFEYKEARYKAIMLMMSMAMDASPYELSQLSLHRPDIKDAEGLDRELHQECRNAMLYASDKVLSTLGAFLEDKTSANFRTVAKAMRKDLYF